MTAVERLGVDLVQAPHSSDQIRLEGFEQQVVVVVHEATGIATPALLLDLFGEEVDEALAIPVVGENRFTCISTGGNVVNGTGELEAERACNRTEIRCFRGVKSSTDPWLPRDSLFELKEPIRGSSSVEKCSWISADTRNYLGCFLL